MRTLDAQLLARAKLTISKTGRLLPDAGTGDVAEQQAADQGLVEVTAANRQIYYQGYHVSLPTTFSGREFYRTINDTEYLFADPTSGEVVFSFLLPMIALQVRGRFVASHSIKGVHMSHPTKQWTRKRAEFQEQHAFRENELPAVFSLN
ncbi:hypothetical protein [Pseudarthrobacter sp. BIM B-2242]|uniref:hypothetical protein n=1 Tax=Pseudarthrobacter sp. BIM B-2242 TaxID=2772401 RepID=UPI00168B81DD|nr:hypothetical protein [Pseudarthrobacter sp. BIM B-2242]QOD04380.1 hypothetical protein IDT60_04780 [Pseudarthrobacter sp. BIM B-2242]